jgi:hypothetical protein
VPNPDDTVGEDRILDVPSGMMVVVSVARIK